MKKVESRLLSALLALVLAFTAAPIMRFAYAYAEGTAEIEITEEALMKAEHQMQLENGHIDFWTIEERYEFEKPYQDMIRARTDDKYRNAVFGLPDDEDIKQEEAMEIARNAVKQKFGENAFDDGREWDRVSIYFWDYYTGEHEWRFSFYSKAVDDIVESFPYYRVRIDAKTGYINEVTIETDMIEGNYGSEYIVTHFGAEYLTPIDPERAEAFRIIDAACDELNEKHGVHYFWPLEAKMSIDELRVELGIYDEPTNGLPSEKEIQQDEAIAIATSAMMEEFGFSEEDMGAMYAGVSFLVSFPDVGRVWQVDFVPDTQEARREGTTVSYNVALRADNGVLIDILPPFN